MPSMNLKRRLSSSKLNIPPISIGCRVINGSNTISSKGRVGLNKPIKGKGIVETDCISFDDIATPLGNLQVSVTYRLDHEFIVEDNPASALSHNSQNLFGKYANKGYNSSFSSSPTNPVSTNSTTNPALIPSFGNSRRSSVSSNNQLSNASPSRSSIDGNSYLIGRSNAYRSHNRHNSIDFSSDNDSSSNLPGSFNGPYIGDQAYRDRRLSSISVRDQHPFQHHGSSPSGNTPISPTATKPSVSFTQPFKTPSLSASPYSNEIGFPANSSNSRPSSFSRTTSNSSLAALRIPNKSTPMASAGSLVGSSSVKNSSGSSHPFAGVLDPNNMSNPNAIVSSASSSRSGSVSRYSSSFGSRTGQWTRAGSISGTRPKRASFGDPSSLGSAIASSTSSSLGDNLSGMLSSDKDDLSSFIKHLDAISLGKVPNSSSSILLGGGSNTNLSSGGGNGSSLLLPQLGSNTIQQNPTTGSIGDSDDDKLSKFRHLKESHMALSDSMHSSHKLDNNSPTSGGSTASPSQGLFSFAMSPPPVVQKTVSSHTPTVPSRLSEEFTADETYKAKKYYSHPRKQGSRSSLPIDEEMFIPDDKSEQDVSESAKTHALDIPQTHVTRLQQRESLSISNRHTSGYKDMQDGLDLSNNAYHQSLNGVGHIIPGKELSSFRSNNPNDNDSNSNTMASSHITTLRGHRFSFSGNSSSSNKNATKNMHVSSSPGSGNGSHDIQEDKGRYTRSSSNLMMTSSSASPRSGGIVNNPAAAASSSNVSSSLNDRRNSSNGLHHVRNHAIEGSSNVMMSMGNHHHHSHSRQTSTSLRSRRLSAYYLPDDEDADDEDGQEELEDDDKDKDIMAPLDDDDVFFFALNDEEEDSAGVSVSTSNNDDNESSSTNNTNNNNNGLFHHSNLNSSNRYDALRWE